MSDKLKCPFCGAELRELKEAGTVVGLFCPDFCITRLAMDKETWQALIDGKKAQDALKVATDFIGFVNTSRHADGALAAMAICKLNEITSITKQEK